MTPIEFEKCPVSEESGAGDGNRTNTIGQNNALLPAFRRAMGIEPTSEAWEALNKTLKAIDLAALSFPSDGLNWKLDGN